jgi:1A family penicillin-binding protein
MAKKVDKRFNRGKTLHAIARKKPPTKPIPVVTPVAKFFQGRWQWFKKLSKPKKVIVIAVPILVILILIPIITYFYFARDINDPERLMNYNNTGVVLLDKNGESFFSFGTADRGERLPLDRISDFTEKALVSAEDKDFYEHGGFSVISILGALYANFLNGDLTGYGGSTLTQQLAKNTLLSEDQTILRKYQELSIAIAIEQNYSKDEILDMYLNSVYYGEGAYGIDTAARTYFNKEAADLDLAESAMLIGLLPAPNAYSPISGNAEYAKERQATVLGRMVDNGAITQAEADAAKAQELAYAPPAENAAGEAPHFAEMILEELYEEYGEERVTRSGFKVTTTLDLNLQKAANDAVDNQIGFIQRNGGSNAAVVAIDPTNGGIRALVGSADYDNEDFGKVNMAITPRQPGSSIKPLYYTEAMWQQIITPGTILEDKPTDFGGYRPLNADRQFRGNVTVRSALSQSLNIPAVEVMRRLGVEKSVEALQRLGISTISNDQDYGLSLALGSAEARLTEMTNAYAAFANKGNQFDTSSIISISDKYDDEVFKQATPSDKRVMGEDAAFLISDILNDEAARAPIFGGSLNTNGYDVAVKTGTTDDARDAWTIGYSRQIAVGVWVGNNDNTAMNNGGSSMAGPIWRSTILAALSGVANQPFTPVPSTIDRVRVCTSNGLRAVGDNTDGTYQEYFIRGTLPAGECTVAPKDSDGDGITDNDDQCANTPANTEVDDEGCTVESPSLTDLDGDGVENGDDLCPNTPENATVAANGCAANQTPPDDDDDEEESGGGNTGGTTQPIQNRPSTR